MSTIVKTCDKARETEFLPVTANNLLTAQFETALQSISELSYLQAWQNMLESRKQEILKTLAGEYEAKLLALHEEIDDAGLEVIYEGYVMGDLDSQLSVNEKEKPEYE